MVLILPIKGPVMTYVQTLNSIVSDIISPAAQANDQKSTFPRAAITALGKAGFLGLMSSKDVGGMGLGLKDAAFVVETVSKSCPSMGMILTMHYCATAVIEKHGANTLRKNIAEGKHLSTLAWSEVGSRSHFWAPVGTAKKSGNKFLLTSQKTMVTSAGEADSYVWSSLPVEAEGAATMWLVERNNPGIAVAKAFDGMGLRGNASAPMYAENLQVDPSAMLGPDGSGFDTMIGIVLPVFCALSASCSLGIAESAITSAIAHASTSNFEHLNANLASLPTIRSYLARAKIKTDMARVLRDDTLTAIETNRADAMLRVMEVKAAVSEAALEVTDTAMRVCGGAAFRKDLDIERFFRDARASHIMAPTSDVLYDFIGKAICNLPVFG
jgi:alkylation response protein AidB-like acyl-CoA dehydrogenase